MANRIRIDSFDAPELDIYARLSEVQLLRYREPHPGIFIAESPKVIERALDAGYEPISFLAEEGHQMEEAKKILARCPEIAVYTAGTEVLKHLTGFGMTRGILCAMNRKVLPTVEDVCAGARRIAVLENVVNPTNVGAIIRSAAALHIDGVLLTSGCSDPLYRRAARVSMGTVFQIPWTFLNEKTMPKKRLSGSGWTEELKRLGFRMAAMALCENTVPIDDPVLEKEEKLAVVLGTEGEGLTEQTIACCDYTVKIPMAHGVDSLNVAAASAVAFWQLTR